MSTYLYSLTLDDGQELAAIELASRHGDDPTCGWFTSVPATRRSRLVSPTSLSRVDADHADLKTAMDVRGYEWAAT